MAELHVTNYQMERIRSVTGCLAKPDATTHSNPNQEKTCETHGEQGKTEPAGLIWRLGSGLYAAGASATSTAFNGAKWAATSTYNVSTSVVGGGVSTVKKMSGLGKEKPKSE